jgi:hypothetical protein
MSELQNIPEVTRVELQPRWQTGQQSSSGRTESKAREASCSTPEVGNEYREFFASLDFKLAPEGEWIDRNRIIEAFRDYYPTKPVQEEPFINALGKHLRSLFPAGTLQKRKSLYNVTCEQLSSTRWTPVMTNKKRAREERFGELQNPDRCRIVQGKQDGDISSRYMTELLQLSCAVALVEHKLFPDAKELSESFSAFNAWRTHLAGDFRGDDSSVTVVSVGDGTTPRTAALFAFRTKFQCVALDPQMNPKEYGIERLQSYKAKIEELRISARRVIVVMVHAHVSLATTMRSIATDSGTAACIALPCCNWYAKINAPNPVVPEYGDMGVLSPHRTVRVWKNLPCGDSDGGKS